MPIPFNWIQYTKSECPSKNYQKGMKIKIYKSLSASVFFLHITHTTDLKNKRNYFLTPWNVLWSHAVVCNYMYTERKKKRKKERKEMCVCVSENHSGYCLGRKRLTNRASSALQSTVSDNIFYRMQIILDLILS